MCLFTQKLSQNTREHGAVTIAFFGDSVTQGYFKSREGMHGETSY